MEEKRPNMYINIVITQLICVLLVTASVLVLKYCFKSDYKEVKAWYLKEITPTTTVSEVLK